MGSMTKNLKDTDGKQKEEKWLENLTLIRLTGGNRSTGIANLTCSREWMANTKKKLRSKEQSFFFNITNEVNL